MLKRAMISLLALAASATFPARAHHASTAEYFMTQQVAIEGTVVKFLFQNPHSFVQVLAPDSDGVVQNWTVEWGPGILLASDNISADTLKPGDQVKITGSPGRVTVAHRLRMRTIERTTDHWQWKGAFGCS
jgi:hypothetical protein